MIDKSNKKKEAEDEWIWLIIKGSYFVVALYLSFKSINKIYSIYIHVYRNRIQ